MVKALVRRYKSQKNRIEQTRPDDIFSGVINAYASAYDPHTSYLPPADSETFNINMSLSLQGIGAVLQSEDEFTKIVNLIPWTSGHGRATKTRRPHLGRSAGFEAL